MFKKLVRPVAEENGYSLIELLVVVLIIGILAATAIPSFLNQKGKANDAGAKAVVRAAQTAEETYFTDNQTYTQTVTDLTAIEPTLAAANPGTPTTPNTLTASGASTTGYTVSVTSGSITPVTYAVADVNGTVTRSCAPASVGGCRAGGTW